MVKAQPFENRGSLLAESLAPGSAALLGSSVLLVLALLGAASARAETARGCLAGAAITEAREFVAAETGNPVPEVCVRSATQERLASVAGPEQRGRVPSNAVAAAYMWASGEILVADDLDFSTPLATSYLVHELVHAQQFAARAQKRASCPGLLETAAYNLQALYLRTKGSREEAVLLQVLGMFQSACNDSY
jgi:hypothetical protein